ncbi:tetratricopeptide repeat protein [Alloalcanivorax gelatiniphagus]|uniref:Tetratricopeptide repeat protein n=1 Tax=Alloalcanivorax gelatiniphagus TaxID=1194167 RepID=A0ABY2XI07_9GAMM|nr:tetratricopeptide repeat protein [Alloalcanivorax gelatiniphagus]TMW10600.1 tetratricopeptide repeat protein [Alloalcanivorax gelatiniphagus]
MNARPSLVVAALLTLAGCAQTPPAPAPTPAPEPRDLPPIQYDGETLGDLLVAESAAQRQSLTVTLDYYDRAARTTNDPVVIAQATKLATYLEQSRRARELADLWLNLEPNNADALRLAALAAIREGDSDGAATLIDRLLAGHGSDALLPLVAEASNMNDADNQELLEALSKLADRYPHQAPLWYARALERRQQQDLPGALDAVKRALKEDPDHLEAGLLQGQLLFEAGQPEKALKRVARQVADHPDSRRARIAYVRLLLAAGDYDGAREQLDVLAEQNPQDLDLQYSLALLALEAGAEPAAEEILQRLLRQGYRPDEMRLHLGQAAEARGAVDEAIDDYLQVKGPDALQARVQAARLLYASERGERGHALINDLINQFPGRTIVLRISEAEMLVDAGDPESALALLDKALEATPDSTNLLYARAMTAGQAGRPEQMEADLRRVLELTPDDAATLNALGYTWADRGIHLEQAHDMIRRALDMHPEDPAILDSMGWVLYRLGRPAEALPYLRRAYQQQPDAEVSAHYGEVLWVLDQRDAALRVWRAALANDPDSTLLLDTLQRLEVTP